MCLFLSWSFISLHWYKQGVSNWPKLLQWHLFWGLWNLSKMSESEEKRKSRKNHTPLAIYLFSSAMVPEWPRACCGDLLYMQTSFPFKPGFAALPSVLWGSSYPSNQLFFYFNYTELVSVALQLLYFIGTE